MRFLLCLIVGFSGWATWFDEIFPTKFFTDTLHCSNWSCSVWVLFTKSGFLVGTGGGELEGTGGGGSVGNGGGTFLFLPTDNGGEVGIEGGLNGFEMSGFLGSLNGLEIDIFWLASSMKGFAAEGSSNGFCLVVKGFAFLGSEFAFLSGFSGGTGLFRELFKISGEDGILTKFDLF